jgi:hypothetical protein
MLLSMYFKQKEQNLSRDVFYLLAFVATIAIMGKTWLMALVALENDDKSNGSYTIIYMPNTSETKSKEEKQTNTPQTQETKANQHDTPSKAPTTPPPAKESKGPKSDIEEIYFESS